MRVRPALLLPPSIVLLAVQIPAHGVAPPGADTSRTQTRDSIPLISISTGDRFTCGLSADGRAFCWGANQFGQLGSPTAPDTCEVDLRVSGPCSLRPVAVMGDTRFAMIDAGDDHVCGLTNGGEAWCWGRNLSGQLGTEDSTEHCSVKDFEKFPRYQGESCSHRPMRVAGNLRYSTIAGGRWITCALTLDGQVRCWGGGMTGPFDDPVEGAPTPRLISADERFVSLTVAYRACGVTASGEIRCFDCCNTTSEPPSRVDAGVALASIVSGAEHNCALSRDREAYCWGRNSSGELGTGSATERGETTAPTKVVTSVRFKSLAAGGAASCGISDEDTLYCWGTGSVLGEQAKDRCHHTDAWDACAWRPSLMGGSRFKTVSVSGLHACAIDATGIAYCWGNNDSGAIGNGTTRFWDHPVRVMGEPTSDTRLFITEDLGYIIRVLTPMILALVVVFTGKRRERVRALRPRSLAKLGLLTFLIFLAVLFLAALLRGSRWPVTFPLAVLAFELIVVVVIVTIYWAAMRLWSLLPRRSRPALR